MFFLWKIRKTVCCIFFTIIFGQKFSVIVYANSEPQNLYALSACLMDADSGRVLFEKSGYEKMAMASTTKIMTLLIALEYGKSEDIVTVSEYAASMPDVQLHMKPGEQYYLRDLLYPMMLESHNDVAVAIAEQVAGSVDEFTSMMNGKAKAIGAMHTNFVTPNGLDAEEHYTTAVDLAKIAAYALKNEEVLRIINTKEYSFSDISQKRQITVTNKNAFLSMMDGAIGVKTGFTGKAGYCFVGAVKRSDRTLISVVLACGWPNNKHYKWSDTVKLMNYGIHSFEQRKIKKEELTLPRIRISHGVTDFACINIKEFYDFSVLMEPMEEISFTYKIQDVYEAPLQKGDTIGTLSLRIGDTFQVEYELISDETVKKTTYYFFTAKVWDLFLQMADIIKKGVRIT